MSDDPETLDASMMLAFRASNARSFLEPFEVSFVASALADPAATRPITWHEGGRVVSVLPATVMFGANGAGKSNVLRSMDDFRRLVQFSFKFGDPNDGFADRKRFLLSDDAREKPTTYEVDLVLNGVRVEYRVEIDDDGVVSESAHHYPKSRAALLFHRSRNEVEFGAVDRVTGRSVQRLLRPNALFLSTAAAAGFEPLVPLYEWFGRNLLLAEASSREFRQAYTASMLRDDPNGLVLALLKAADLGIVDAKAVEPDPVFAERFRRAIRVLNGVEPDSDDEGPSFEHLGVELLHDSPSGPVPLPAEDESLGTRVWFGLVGPIADALKNGSVLLADELDASLHPKLVEQLLRLFQDRQMNPNRAQLVCNTHDATLLGGVSGSGAIGRDQVWFVEKSNDGASRIYPLSDFSPRKGEAIADRYLAGRYGAVPIVSDGEFRSATDLIDSIA